MHENTREIQLDLETHIHIGVIDGRWPPQSKTTIPNLIQTETLSISQFFVLNGFFKLVLLLALVLALLLALSS